MLLSEVIMCLNLLRIWVASILSVLKHCDDGLSVALFSFSVRHLMDPFNLEIHVTQFWDMFLNYPIDDVFLS